MTRPVRRACAAAALVVLGVLAWSAAAFATPGGGNSAATVTGSFSDRCRDFSARSTKDISFVERHYADGRVIKDEAIDQPDYSIDGTAGNELELAVVKTGTTSQTFICPRTNSPPTAVLELETPPLSECMYFPWPAYPTCLAADPRTVWSRAPGGAFAFVFVVPDLSPSFRFRGTSSVDPDGDIEHWSIDFGDGASISGSWATDPPTGILHTFSPLFSTVTLTVTDSAGQSASDTLALIGIDAIPD